MKSFFKKFCIPLLVSLVLFGVLMEVSVGHPDHVDHTDEEIDAMGIDSLVHVEHDLRSQNGIVDKHIASLQGRLAVLKRQQDLLQWAERNVSHARDWEIRQKRARRKELERARAELEAKKEQTRMLQHETNKLREEIQELKDAMTALNLEKTKLDDQYSHPSLDAILIHKAARVGPVSQHILNKTIQHIVPEVEHGLQEVRAAQEKFPTDSSVMTALKSFCIYMLALSVLYISCTFLRNLRSLFTLTRILFTVDMTFAFTWISVCFFYMLLSDDPLGMMAKRHGGLTVVVQIVLLGALFGNVILRCISFSLHFRRIAFMELVCIVLLTQHYYQSVWRPCLLDETLMTTFGTYFMYFFISAGLAVYRARSFGRGMEEVQDSPSRSGSLSFLQKGKWLKMKMEGMLRYCENLLSRLKQEDVKFQVEPQYYRKSRHPEFSRTPGRSVGRRSALRPERKPTGYWQEYWR